MVQEGDRYNGHLFFESKLEGAILEGFHARGECRDGPFGEDRNAGALIQLLCGAAECPGRFHMVAAIDRNVHLLEEHADQRPAGQLMLADEQEIFRDHIIHMDDIQVAAVVAAYDVRRWWEHALALHPYRYQAQELLDRSPAALQPERILEPFGPGQEDIERHPKDTQGNEETEAEIDLEEQPEWNEEILHHEIAAALTISYTRTVCRCGRDHGSSQRIAKVVRRPQ